jgi:hypothetical protein
MDGYFPGVKVNDPVLQAAIDTIAEQIGITVRPRCAMPDAAARDSIVIWRHRPVRAAIRGSLPGLSAGQLVDMYKKALGIWNSCMNVGLQWSDDFSSANIQASCSSIDGRSGTLALSYFPPGGSGSTINSRITQTYDTAEGWTVPWALEVMLHELGHAVGCDHINHKGALMYPYSAGGRILAPTQYELDILVPLYGKPIAVTPVPVVHGGVLIFDNGSMAPINAGRVDYAGQSYQVSVTK